MVPFLFSLVFNLYQQIKTSYEPRRKYLLTLATYSIARKKEEGLAPQTSVNTYFLYDFLARMSLSIFHNGIGVSAERQMEQISERTISLRTQSPVPG